MRQMNAVLLSLAIALASAAAPSRARAQTSTVGSKDLAPIAPPPPTSETGAATPTPAPSLVPVTGTTAVPPAASPAPSKKMPDCLKWGLIGGTALAGIVGLGAFLNGADGGDEAGKDKSSKPGDIKTKTAAQEKCRQNAPSKPGRVVFGFDGLGGATVFSQPLRRNMLEPAQKANSRVHTNYYSQAEVTSNELGDAVRCAYELATKPYKTKDGKTVYNTITIMGYSYGGHAASQLADNLKRLGIAVDLVITADPRVKGAIGSGRFEKTANIGKWVNVWGYGLLSGGQVAGGENHNVTLGSTHMTITTTQAMQDAIRKNMSQLPACRLSYTKPQQYGSTADCAF